MGVVVGPLTEDSYEGFARVGMVGFVMNVDSFHRLMSGNGVRRLPVPDNPARTGEPPARPVIVSGGGSMLGGDVVGRGGDARARFHAAIERAVRHFGGDRAAADRSGISKSVWYDAKRGRAIPDRQATWPAMRAVLVEAPPAVTKVDDWEALYSKVLAECGRSDPDPPRERRAASRSVPQQLPPSVRDFVGRDEQLALLDELLVRPRDAGVAMAVITGRPGVGKTALAVRWAGLRSASFSDGILYADLRGWSVGGPVHPEVVLPGWLRALGIDPATVPDDVDSRSALLRTLLDDRRVLVVLDNVRDEDQVRPLLPASNSCAVLVTSRHILTGLAVRYGAEIVEVPYLSDDESMSLLRNSLGARADAEESASTLISLCAGLPLTLQIVAQTLKGRPALPMSSFATELADDSRRLSVLEHDDPGSDPRTIVSWSHHQLRDDVARMFGSLGLIPGTGVHIDAVAAVAGVDRVTAARQIRALDRAHLVTLTDSRRVELHDLVHCYAAELGAESRDSADAALARLFDYYLHTTRRADELLEPLRYRIELSATSVEATPLHTFEEALSWLESEQATMVALCELDLPALDSARWRLAFLLRGYFFRTLRLFEWVSSHEQAVRATVRSGDRLGEAMSRANLGVAWHKQGDDDAALAQFRIARELFDEQGDIRGFAGTLAHEAAVCRRRGEFAEAIRLDSAALETYLAVGTRRNVAITLRGLGISESAMEQWVRAAEHLEQSRIIARELNMHMDAARAANGLGWLHIRAERTAAAEAAFRDAIDSDTRSGGRYETAVALHGLGTVAKSRGCAAQAKDLWREASAILESMGSPRTAEVRAALASLSEPGAGTTRAD
ncbi:tetratricopeptide repeat protein [Nocardia sp. NPDC058176]|uniref:tetratricopeptide repeat protein n=1 Tax=Nocardia sp. NPDC058176 TaxID=3346368 RepID=UPI0036DC6B57